MKKKIAVACDNGMVTKHFGHCECFNIFETEYNRLVNGMTVQNPSNLKGHLPNYLHEMGVNVVISGGMGSGAVKRFSDNGIEVITGAEGSVAAAVKSYLAGTLETEQSICQEHHHHHHHHHNRHHDHHHERC